jgi:hypothetical protein
MPKEAQKQMPVSKVGPLTMRGQRRATGLEQCLYGLELGDLDDRRQTVFLQIRPS